RLAMMLFTILATLAKWDINPRLWLAWFLESCAENGGKAPTDPSAFLPWNLSPEKLAQLGCRNRPNSTRPGNTVPTLPQRPPFQLDTSQSPAPARPDNGFGEALRRDR